MQGLAENILAVLGDKTPGSLDAFFCLWMNMGRSGALVRFIRLPFCVQQCLAHGSANLIF